MKNKSSLLWTVLSVTALGGVGVGLLTSEPDMAPPRGGEESYSEAEIDSRWDGGADPMAGKTTVKNANNGAPLPPKGKQLPSGLRENADTVVSWEAESIQRSDKGYSFEVKTDSIKRLQVGQSVQIDLPKIGSISGVITKTNNRYGNNNVFTAEVEDRNDIDNVTIVRGKNITFMTVATRDGTYGTQINNNTGKAQMWDESIARMMGANVRNFITNTTGSAGPPPDYN